MFVRARHTLGLIPLVLASACGSSADREGESLGQVQQTVLNANQFKPFPMHVLPFKLVNLKTNKCLKPATSALDSTIIVQTCDDSKALSWFAVPNSDNGAFDNGYFFVSGIAHGRFLSIRSASKADGALAQTYSGWGEPVNEAWQLAWITGTSTFLLKNYNSQKCLDLATGTAAQQSCNEAAVSQQFQAQPRPFPFSISALHSNKCLNVANGSSANNEVIQQYPCGGWSNERWNFVYKKTVNGVDLYNIVAMHSGKCLDVPNASTTSGVALQQFDCWANADNELWSIVMPQEGIFRFKNYHSGLCAAVRGSSNLTNAVIQQEACTGISSQNWRFTYHAEPWLKLTRTYSNANDRKITTTEWANLVSAANEAYSPYGVIFHYDEARDIVDLQNTGLYNETCNVHTTITCPDGTQGTEVACANRYAATFPGFMTVISRKSSQGCGDDMDDFTRIGSSYGPITTCVTPNIPNNRHLGHELGHYLSLPHPHGPDWLVDTPSDPGGSGCAGYDGGVPSNVTSNIMSYYYAPKHTLSPTMGSILRTQMFALYSNGAQ